MPRPDHHIVNFSKHDFSSFQQKLNKEAADGYRLADVALTGSDSAEVVLEKLSTPEKYDYLVLREGNYHTLETELNKSGANGYRLCKQTFSMMVVNHWQMALTVILEKSPNAISTRYTYRIHESVRIASMQNETAKDQSEGYNMVATTNWSGVYFGVFEKEVKPDAAKPARE